MASRHFGGKEVQANRGMYLTLPIFQIGMICADGNSCLRRLQLVTVLLGLVFRDFHRTDLPFVSLLSPLSLHHLITIPCSPGSLDMPSLILQCKGLARVAACLLFSSLGVAALSLGSRATTCNGHSEVEHYSLGHFTGHSYIIRHQLCSRTYGNVSFVGAHDSYAVGTNNRKCLPCASRNCRTLSLFLLRSFCKPGL